MLQTGRIQVAESALCVGRTTCGPRQGRREKSEADYARCSSTEAYHGSILAKSSVVHKDRLRLRRRLPIEEQ